MQRFREQHWEFGPQPSSHQRRTLTGDEGEEIDVTLELSDKERVSHYGFKHDKLSIEDDLVVKVFWAEATRTSEPDILKRVYEIAHDQDIKGHVPVMLWYKSFEETSTAKVRQRLGLKTEGARVLYTIIFRKLRPITELTGRGLPACVVGDGHLALWKNDVYHRDISASNLMYRTVNGKIVGVLNDFDLASTEKTATGTERTGTIPFMANMHEGSLKAGKGHEENWKLATAYINALVMINATISTSPEDQDPYVQTDDAFKVYLSDVIRPFLEIPADGPREDTTQVVTSCLASESEEWELVSTNANAE
ncbi:hypothetical protein L210DRAFT_3569339, partial [Boletus edulis BED1]